MQLKLVIGRQTGENKAKRQQKEKPGTPTRQPRSSDVTENQPVHLSSWLHSERGSLLPLTARVRGRSQKGEWAG